MDLNYTAGASYNCTKNICCRPYDAADEVGVTDYPAGPYGNNACDAPLALEESMYAAVKQIAPNATFTLVALLYHFVYVKITNYKNADCSSIFTGDVVEGAVWLVTGKSLLQTSYHMLKNNRSRS